MTGSAWRTWQELMRSDLPLNRTSRESLATLAIWRMGQVLHERPGVAAFALRRVHGVLDQVWTRNTIGAELPRSVVVGPGMKLPHAGRGVIVHPQARLGASVTLHHRVTIGVRNAGRPPHIADGVYLGAGAAVLGPVDLGPGCKIGANAVVVKDVPAGATVIAGPVRVLPAPGS
ncbi:serine acetyltransferase [Kineococcus sp. R8]|uniref:serine acetyltransferase n=1 Tax=Kineococcus siccus TaxID=2696567 RepID=UPI0014123F4A|nr:serine acetyltransferase [Kineococcus siccus]NAZ81532.1 serine acetyltransferase [Kineococcus siccus]